MGAKRRLAPCPPPSSTPPRVACPGVAVPEQHEESGTDECSGPATSPVPSSNRRSPIDNRAPWVIHLARSDPMPGGHQPTLQRTPTPEIGVYVFDMAVPAGDDALGEFRETIL
jgi:hypothetical protein